MPGLSRVISRDGEEALREAMQVLFGAITDFLQASRDNGRTHLCIVPHGALHFMPFHLFGAAHAALATEWVVTYLPLLELLLQNRVASEPVYLEVTCRGAGFQGRDPIRNCRRWIVRPPLRGR